MKLYSAVVCPFAQRARLALAEKGQPYETHEIDLRNIPDWYRQISPNGKVPLLVLEDGRQVWESSVIAEYVDEAFEGPALMPADPVDRALVRIWLARAGEGMIFAFYKILMQPGEESLQKMDVALTEMEGLPRRGTEGGVDGHDWGAGPYWLGAQFSMADLLIYPWFERWPVLEHYRQQVWNAKKHPQLTRWLEAMSRRSSVVGDGQHIDLYLSDYKTYADRGDAAAAAR